MWFFRSLTTAIIIIFTAYALEKILNVFNVLDELQESVIDFDFTDLYYSMFFSAQPLDTNIVLINVANRERDEIAGMLTDIQQFKPRVIGLDVSFKSLKADSTADSLLRESISDIQDLIMVSVIISKNGNKPDSIRYSHPFFRVDKTTGYVNMNIPEGDRLSGTVRSFYNYVEIDGKVYYPFAYEVIRVYRPEALNNYPDDRQEEVLINFSGYGSWVPANRDKIRYQSLDREDLAAIDSAIIRDKIVLVGMLGKNVRDSLNIEDKFYTPLNKRITARAIPDMYGVEIHANIISMILNDDYIRHSRILDYLITLIFLLLVIILFDYLVIRKRDGYQFISKITVLVLINMLIILSLELFNMTMIKIDIRLLIFFLVITPDTQEFVYFQLFRRWGWMRQ